MYDVVYGFVHYHGPIRSPILVFHSHQAGNVKQGHIQFQETHPPVFVTSNLSSKSLFIKAKKEAGSSCQISADDYCKLLTLEEGRVGTELIMDLPVSLFTLCWVLAFISYLYDVIMCTLL